MSAPRQLAAKTNFEILTATGRRHFAELRCTPKMVEILDFEVGYKVWFLGEHVEIARYDCVVGRIHRRRAGCPQPDKIKTSSSPFCTTAPLRDCRPHHRTILLRI